MCSLVLESLMTILGEDTTILPREITPRKIPLPQKMFLLFLKNTNIENGKWVLDSIPLLIFLPFLNLN